MSDSDEENKQRNRSRSKSKERSSRSHRDRSDRSDRYKSDDRNKDRRKDSDNKNESRNNRSRRHGESDRHRSSRSSRHETKKSEKSEKSRKREERSKRYKDSDSESVSDDDRDRGRSSRHRDRDRKNEDETKNDKYEKSRRRDRDRDRDRDRSSRYNVKDDENDRESHRRRVRDRNNRDNRDKDRKRDRDGDNESTKTKSRDRSRRYDINDNDRDSDRESHRHRDRDRDRNTDNRSSELSINNTKKTNRHYDDEKEEKKYNICNDPITLNPYSLQHVSEFLPPRPTNPLKGSDCDGTSVDLLSNIFDIEVTLDRLHKYDIEFTPPIQEDSRDKRKDIFRLPCVKQEIEYKLGDFFEDNTRIYGEKKYSRMLTIPYAHNKTLTLKYGQKLDIKDLTVQYKMQIIGIVLQKWLKKVGLRRLNRCHYDMSKQAQIKIVGENDDDPQDLVIYPGFKTSIESTVKGLAIGFDTTSRLMHNSTVHDKMKEWKIEIDNQFENLHKNERREKWIKLCNERLIKRSCTVLAMNKIYTIHEINFNLNIESIIPNSRDNITIKQYWQQTQDFEVEKQGRGMIVVQNKAKKNDTNYSFLYIPPELLTLTGYDQNFRNRRNVTTAISKQTRIPAYNRFKMTLQLVKKLDDISNKDSEIRHKIRFKHIKSHVKGTILKSPEIYYRAKEKLENPPKENNDKTILHITGPEGLQQDLLQNGSFLERASPIKYWALVYETGGRENLNINKFLSALEYYSNDQGVKKAFHGNNCKKIEVPYNNRDRGSAWKNTLLDALFNRKFKDENNVKKIPIECIIAILPKDKDKIVDDIYSNIKGVCSVDRAIHSQCLKSIHMENKNVIIGVLRQLLVKLGSIPWKIRFNLKFKKIDLNKPTMIVGININHDTKQSHSTVGFTASYDRDFVRYCGLLQYHNQGGELISDGLGALMKTALVTFKKLNKIYPDQIIIYRDGVSSTQIEQVYNIELQQIKDCVRNICNNTKITFIAVQKRINTRFLIATNYKSAPPGTFVNDTIVSNQMWDFYIVPAQPPENCLAIPTKFVVIYDELKLYKSGKGEHDLATLTNGLCCLYFNWPGPTRVPAPIKYAMKLAQQYCQNLSKCQPNDRLRLTYHYL